MNYKSYPFGFFINETELYIVILKLNTFYGQLYLIKNHLS